MGTEKNPVTMSEIARLFNALDVGNQSRSRRRARQRLRDCVEEISLLTLDEYAEALSHKLLGTRMEVKPGWRRPRLVDVLSWGERGAECNRDFAIVRCVESGTTHVYPHHQLVKPCWRCNGARAVYAERSRKTFDCPACKFRWETEDAYPADLQVMFGRKGPESRGF